jgi:hypothetical protein
MSCVFGIHQGNRDASTQNRHLCGDFEKPARAEGVRMGIIPRRVLGFSPCGILPRARENFPMT